MLPDSVLREIENDTFILYDFGRLWSALIKRDNGLVALTGQKKWVHDAAYPSDEEIFDTVGLLDTYKETINWGFDSLPELSLKMAPVYRTEYSPFYSFLQIFHSDKHRIFNSDNAIAFAGPDSAVFNSKLGKLKDLMLWLSFPFIRPYTSDSVFCSPILRDRLHQTRKLTYAGTFQRNVIDSISDIACAKCVNTMRRLESLSLNAFIAWAKKEYNVRDISFVIYGLENQTPLVYKTNSIAPRDYICTDSLFPQFEPTPTSISQLLKSGHTIAGISSQLNEKTIEITINALVPDSTDERENSFNQISCLYTYRLGLAAEKEDPENCAVAVLLEEIAEDNENFITDGFLSDEVLNEFEWRIFSVKVDIKSKKSASDLDKITFDNFNH